MKKTYIHYSKLPETSFTKIGWLRGGKLADDEINVTYGDGEFAILWDESMEAVKLEIWYDCFQYLTDPLFATLAALTKSVKNITMDDIVVALETSGYVCRNDEVR